MNWDWDKLQEKQQQQPKRKIPKQEDPHGNNQRDPKDFFKQFKIKKPSSDGGGNTPDFNIFKNSFPIKLVVLGAVLLWLASGIYIVSPGELGVVLRFGEYSRTTIAGPHYHIPFPIERVYLPQVSQIRQTEVGFRSQYTGDTFQQGNTQNIHDEASMLTGDENIVNIQFSIQYNIKPEGAVDYLFNVKEPDSVVKKAAEAAMREIIGKTTLDEALTGGRVRIQGEVQELLQSILDSYQVGIQVVAVQMQDVQPPTEVRDAFKDVASAREDRERLTNEAEAYRSDILPKAKGTAAETLNIAEAYKQTRILAAQGEGERFLAILAEYEKSKDVTKQRMMYEALEDIMSQPGMEKLILPDGMTNSIIPMMPMGSSGVMPTTGFSNPTNTPSLYNSTSNIPSSSSRPNSNALRGIN